MNSKATKIELATRIATNAFHSVRRRLTSRAISDAIVFCVLTKFPSLGRHIFQQVNEVVSSRIGKLFDAILCRSSGKTSEANKTNKAGGLKKEN
jgi:hypothetical protein